MPARIANVLRAALLPAWLPVAAAAQLASPPRPAERGIVAPGDARGPSAGGMLVPPPGAPPPAVSADPGIVAPTPEPPERTMPLVLPPGSAENPTRPR